jgi:hypothetical protein
MATAKPMRVYRLLWLLIVHALHGRFRDEVHLCVTWDQGPSDGIASGPMNDFTWVDDRDAFCVISADADYAPMFLN